jgi:hypothetical protein
MRILALTSIVVLALSACTGTSSPAPRTSPPPDLTGMYSDPPATALDTLCFFNCTQTGLVRLAALLDDPGNDARPSFELLGDAANYQVAEYLRPRLTEAALAAPPIDDLKDDRGYLYCEPWGFAWQAFAPHQLQITQYPDRVELHYGEWDARRIVHLEGRTAPQGQTHSPLGYSVGHYEGDTLVVETSLITANSLWVGTIGANNWLRPHSDQLTAIERFRRPSPERLELTATLADPWALREPLELKKVWSFAPDQEIAPYDSCQPAAAKSSEGKTQ